MRHEILTIALLILLLLLLMAHIIVEADTIHYAYSEDSVALFHSLAKTGLYTPNNIAVDFFLAINEGAIRVIEDMLTSAIISVIAVLPKTVDNRMPKYGRTALLHVAALNIDRNDHNVASPLR